MQVNNVQSPSFLGTVKLHRDGQKSYINFINGLGATEKESVVRTINSVGGKITDLLKVDIVYSNQTNDPSDRRLWFVPEYKKPRINSETLDMESQPTFSEWTPEAKTAIDDAISLEKRVADEEKSFELLPDILKKIKAVTDNKASDIAFRFESIDVLRNMVIYLNNLSVSSRNQLGKSLNAAIERLKDLKEADLIWDQTSEGKPKFFVRYNKYSLDPETRAIKYEVGESDDIESLDDAVEATVSKNVEVIVNSKAVSDIKAMLDKDFAPSEPVNNA